MLLVPGKRYRKEVTARFEFPKPRFHEAGTCFGRDIAAAATIVARSNRRVHMFASSVKIRSCFQVTDRRHRAMPAVSVHRVGIDRQALSDARYLLLLELGVPLAPQSFAAHCGSLGLRLAHFEDLLFCPERVAAGVLLAFSCAAPELLMCCFALSRPVDLLVLLASLLLLEPVEVPAPDIEPEPPSLLVVPVEPMLPDVPVLLVPVLLPFSEEPLVVPAVVPLADELPVPLIEELLDGDVLLP